MKKLEIDAETRRISTVSGILCTRERKVRYTRRWTPDSRKNLVWHPAGITSAAPGRRPISSNLSILFPDPPTSFLPSSMRLSLPSLPSYSLLRSSPTARLLLSPTAPPGSSSSPPPPTTSPSPVRLAGSAFSLGTRFASLKVLTLTTFPGRSNLALAASIANSPP
ncbi:hypothetical protein LZ30DRAFT_325599 [Colletotrichum cereale]|nr:hypothetical protein LZ30DRAFT_325599 [Colletotrichum cereale]